ncbi:MAG: GntR family transcriptional regulator [Planctomycetes bacterium]|nr:GntR family transcriptional regulator [Planctomycetota bacterium]
MYQQVYDSIRHSITSGELIPGAPFPSERDLTTQLQITRPTLRQALEQLEREGYVRRQHGIGTFVEQPAKWKPTRKVLNLGIVTWEPELKGYWKDLLGKLCAEAGTNGMEVRTLLGPHRDAPTPDLEKRVVEAKLDGVIAFATTLRGNLDPFSGLRVPKVMLELRDRIEGADNVVVDSRRGMYEGVRELIRLGHREIGFVGAVFCDHNPGREGLFKLAPETETRFKAYRSALEDAGIAYRPELYAELPFTDEIVDAWVLERQRAGTLPTALATFDDLMANLVIHGCRRCGLAVPGDVSVLGFGNILPEAQRGEVATASIDFTSMARLAVERIHERATRGGMAGMILTADSAFKSGASIARPASKG